MKITKEILETIYNRTNEFAKIKYNEEPDLIYIDCSGNLNIRYISYCCGETDIDDHEINIENLNEDLDELAKKALEEKEKERIKEQERKQLQEQQRQIKEKENRKQQYLKLKQEFES